MEKEKREKFIAAINSLDDKPVITICRQGGKKAKQNAVLEITYSRQISSVSHSFDDNELRQYLSFIIKRILKKDKIYMSVASYFRQKNYLKANILLLRLNFIEDKKEIMEYYKKFVTKFIKIIRGKPWKAKVIMVKIGKE